MLYKRAIAVLCCPGLLVVAGCGLDDALLGLVVWSISAPELVRQAAGEQQCQSMVCNKALWLNVSVGSVRVRPNADWHTCVQSYALDFASYEGNPVVAASLNEAAGLVFAFVTRDGAVHLAEFGSPSSIRSLRLNAVGAAWSNAGDRLALVTRQPDLGADVLTITDAELNTLESFQIELPRPRDYVIGPRTWVSWNVGDTTVAVSTNFAAPAFIVDLDSKTVHRHQLSGVFYIGSDRIVARIPGCRSGCVQQFMVQQNGQLAPRGTIPAAVSVIASHAATGVFVTHEPEIPGYLDSNSVGLRTSEAGPDIFANNVMDEIDVILIVPIEAAFPVLEAAGFGPEDAPQPDELDRCPE